MIQGNGRLFSGGIFWAVFALMGVVIALRAAWLEVALGIAVVFLGIAKLGNDLERKRLRGEQEALQETLQGIREWAQKEYEHIKGLESRYENRFFHAARKHMETERRAEKHYREMERRMEANYRELVKKVLEVDNKLAQLSRAFLTTPPRSGRRE